MTIEYRIYVKARHLLSLNEVLHYLKCDGSERALRFFYTFFGGDLDFKTENKIVRGIITNDLALLENTIEDIEVENRKLLKDLFK